MKSREKDSKDPERAYERAMEIIDQEWREAGASQQEIDRSKELTAIFDRLLGSGYAKDVIRAAWEAEYPDTVSLYLRLLAIAERALEPNDPALVQILHRLAKLYEARGDYATAEPFFARALTLREKSSGAENSGVAAARAEYTTLLRATGREAEAQTLEASAR